MHNKSILMPHACQKVGWCLMALTLILFLVNVLFIRVIRDIDVAWYLAKASHLTLILALFFLCFSKEKVEDEMISSLRLKAVGITGYVFFILFLLLSLTLELQLYRLIPCLDTGSLELYLSELFLIVLPLLIFGLYFLLFKGMLCRSKKQPAL